MQADRQAGIHTSRQARRQRDRDTSRQADRQTDIQTARQTGRQTYIHSGSQAHRLNFEPARPLQHALQGDTTCDTEGDTTGQHQRSAATQIADCDQNVNISVRFRIAERNYIVCILVTCVPWVPDG